MSAPPLRAVRVHVRWGLAAPTPHADQWDALMREAKRDGIPAHQTAWLDDAHRSGAVALVVVEFVRAAGATRYAVPWGDIPWEGDSVGPSTLAPWRVDGGLYLARWTLGPSGAGERPGGAVAARRGGGL